MTNEALETHVVRYANVLAVPRPENSRVFVTSQGDFWEGTQATSPTRALASEGDCAEELRAFDGTERFSTSDSVDLATRETIDLEFESVPEGRLGLVIAARQSLLTTYLFYQILSYMGESAGSYMAQMERGGEFVLERSQAIGQLLGGIEVQLKDDSGEWVTVGQVGETGPLATDTRVVPLPEWGNEHRTVRLRLTRGHWRLDYVALVQLGGQVEPLRLEPSLVMRDGGIDDSAQALLTDSTAPLVTFPGDEYTISYTLPEDFTRYELFLESRGYYLEWMRNEWLAEEDPARVAQVFMDPEGALRTLAPGFKRVEPVIEELFWKSRYVRH
jgi:hypothetical protein